MLSCQSSKLCDFKTWWKLKSATWRNIRTRPIIKNIEKVLVWFMWIWLKLRMKWSSRLLFPSTIVSALFFFRGPVAWKWSRSRAALIYAPFVWNRLLHYSRLLFPHLADIFTRNENSFFIPTISFKRFFFLLSTRLGKRLLCQREKNEFLFAFMSLRSPVLFPFNDPFICSGWSCSRSGIKWRI